MLAGEQRASQIDLAETDVVGTPEGDNEFAPDEPLKPLPDGAEENTRDATPHDPYKQDHP